MNNIGLNQQLMNQIFDDQDRTQWCWAACCEGIFKYKGYHMEQEDFVIKGYGSLVNKPGGYETFWRVLNHDGVDRLGKPYRIRANHFWGSPSVETIVHELSQNDPIILEIPTGYMTSHAILLTRATVVNTVFGPRINDITYRDPWMAPNFELTKGCMDVVGQFLARTNSYFVIQFV